MDIDKFKKCFQYDPEKDVKKYAATFLYHYQLEIDKGRTDRKAKEIFLTNYFNTRFYMAGGWDYYCVEYAKYFNIKDLGEFIYETYKRMNAITDYSGEIRNYIVEYLQSRGIGKE